MIYPFLDLTTGKTMSSRTTAVNITSRFPHGFRGCSAITGVNGGLQVALLHLYIDALVSWHSDCLRVGPKSLLAKHFPLVCIVLYSDRYDISDFLSVRCYRPMFRCLGTRYMYTVNLLHVC